MRYFEKILKRIKRQAAQFQPYLRKHRLVRRVIIVVCCIVLALPVVLPVRVPFVRYASYMAADLLYRHRPSCDDRIAILYAASPEKEYVSALIASLNEDESSRPAVIGVDVNYSADELKDLAFCLSDGFCDNLVFADSLDTPADAVLTCGRFPDDFSVSGSTLAASDFLRTGYNNVFSDEDGIARHYVWSLEQEQSYVSFARACAERYSEYSGVSCTPRLSSAGTSLISFAGNEEAFQTVSTAADGSVTGKEDLTDKIVLIASAAEMNAPCITPVSRGNRMTNVCYQANMLYGLLNGNSARDISMTMQTAVTFFLTAFFIDILIEVKKYRYWALSAAGIIAAGLFSGWLLWRFAGIVFYSLYITLDIVLYLIAALVVLCIRSVRASNSAESEILKLYMDSNISYKLVAAAHDDDDSMDDSRKKVAVMFADICGFTSMCESMAPENVTRFLNTFFEIAEDCVHNCGGIVDKYMGDNIMSFWIDYAQDGGIVFDICRAALDIQRRLVERSDEIIKTFGHELAVSIGINYGEAVVGSIGSENRKDYTIVGDMVNTASRLQSAAPYNTIYISESMVNILGDMADITPIPEPIALKGKSQLINIYTLNDMGTVVEENKPIRVHRRESGYVLTVLGSRGSLPASGSRFDEFGGETSCYVFKKDKHAVVLDCGTGLYKAKALLEGCEKIDVILTHMHYDHVLGLLNFSIFPADAKLTFYSQFSKWFREDTINVFLNPPFWPVNLSRGDMVSVDPGEVYHLNDMVDVTFFPSFHADDSSLVYLCIGDHRICVMTDCEDPDYFPEEFLTSCDILMCDGMYDSSGEKEHEGWGHMSWQKAVNCAASHDVGKLLVCHHGPSCTDEKLRNYERRAQEMYPGTKFLRCGDRFFI